MYADSFQARAQYIPMSVVHAIGYVKTKVAKEKIIAWC